MLADRPTMVVDVNLMQNCHQTHQVQTFDLMKKMYYSMQVVTMSVDKNNLAVTFSWLIS
jgi:hypothetical protein